MIELGNHPPQHSSRMQIALQQFYEWLAQRNFSDKKDDNSLVNQADVNTDSISPTNYAKQLSLLKTLESCIAIAEDFSQLLSDIRLVNEGVADAKSLKGESIIDVSKSFATLVQEGPKNDSERKLLNAVDTLLTADQKQTAVRQQAPLGAVVKLVQKSIEDLQQNEMQKLSQEYNKKITKEKQLEENHKPPEKKMTSLGDWYGVVAKVVESIKERSVLGSQDNTADQKTQNTTKPLFSAQGSVSLDNATIKTPTTNMPQRENEKGIAR
jgi:hypothetical protein